MPDYGLNARPGVRAQCTQQPCPRSTGLLAPVRLLLFIGGLLAPAIWHLALRGYRPPQAGSFQAAMKAGFQTEIQAGMASRLSRYQ